MPHPTPPSRALRPLSLSINRWLELRVTPPQVPPQHIQQRSDLSGHPAEPMEPDLRHLRHPDVDPVPLVRPQPGIPGKFGGNFVAFRACVPVSGVVLLLWFFCGFSANQQPVSPKDLAVFARGVVVWCANPEELNKMWQTYKYTPVTQQAVISIHVCTAKLFLDAVARGGSREVVLVGVWGYLFFVCLFAIVGVDHAS